MSGAGTYATGQSLQALSNCHDQCSAFRRTCVMYKKAIISDERGTLTINPLAPRILSL